MRIAITIVACLLVLWLWMGPGTAGQAETVDPIFFLAQATGTMSNRQYLPSVSDEPTYTPTPTFTLTTSPAPTLSPTPSISRTPYPPVIATFVAELTGTAGPAVTQTAVQSAIQTSVAATVAAIISPSPTPPSAFELRFTSAVASSDNNSNNLAGYAFDQNVETFWRPNSGVNGQLLDLSFSSPQTVQYVRFVTAMGDSVVTTATVQSGAATPTPPATNYRVRLMNPNESACFDTVQQLDRAVVQVNCPTTGNVNAVRIYVDSTNNQVPAGVREVLAFAPNASSTATQTQVPSSTSTSTTTPTQTATFTTPQAQTATVQAINTQLAGTATTVAISTGFAATQTAAAVMSIANQAATATSFARTSVAGTSTACTSASPSCTPTLSPTITQTPTVTTTLTATRTPTLTPNATQTEAAIQTAIAQTQVASTVAARLTQTATAGGNSPG